MSIIAWLILGLIGGWVASKLMGSGGYGVIGYMIVGILGALVGGWLTSLLLGIDVTGLNFTSIAISIVGAVIVIAIYRALSGRRSVV